MTEVKTWTERCQDHPAHQSGMITNQMIQDRMQEEIDELRAQPKYKRVDLKKLQLPCSELDQKLYINCYLSNENARGYNRAIDDIKSKYGDLYYQPANKE